MNLFSLDDGRLGVPFRSPPGSDPESVVRNVLKYSEVPEIMSGGNESTKHMSKLSKPDKIREICTGHLESRQSSSCQTDLSSGVPNRRILLFLLILCI